MVGTKITHPRDRQHKNNLLKGQMDGELNSPHENNLPKGWIAQK